MANPVTASLLAWLGRLSYPRLFVVAAVLFVVSLVFPDPVPLVDELLLGVGTLLLANFKRRDRKRKDDDPPAIGGESTRH